MSLSRYFKDNGSFTPKSLVPGSASEKADWAPAAVPSAEQTKLPPQDDVPKATHQETERLSEEASAPAGVQEPLDQEQRGIDIVSAEPPAVMPDIESIQKEAYEAGIKQGLKQAQADFGSAQTALTLLCDQLSSIRETILKNSKDEMVELVIALSEKIIRHSVTEQNQTIVDTVETAIHQAVKSSEFYIYIHPDDMSIIQDRTQTFISGLNGLDNIVVKPDSSIERGGCRVESDNCTVDATVSSQFKVLQERILKKK